MQVKNKNHQLIDKLHNTEIIFCGVNIAILSQIFLFEYRLGRMQRNSILGIIKKCSLDNYLKAISSIFNHQNNVFKQTEVFFLNDIFNKSMVSNMRIVQDAFEENYTEIIADKRLKLNNNVFLWHYFRVFDYLIKLPRYILCLYRSRTKLKYLSKLFKTPFLLLILNLLDTYFILICTKSVIKKSPFLKQLVLNTDAHKISRAFVLFCKQEGIKTNVLQHGATVLDYGYLPVMADKMFTWGELSNKWFTNRGTNEERLSITGTPKMDLIHVPKYSLITSIKKILVVVNPIGNTQVLNYLNLLYKAKIHENYELTLKLHPSSMDNIDEVTKVFGNEDIKILKDNNIHELIKNSDVTITTTSTVANETIAFFKPLIQVTLCSFPSNILDYDRLNCCITIKSSKELKEVLSDMTMINSKIKNYNDFISQYFYKLDGRASKRILSEINKSK